MKPTILSILIADEPAAHERLLNVLRRRAPKIASLSLAREGDGLTRFTVALEGDRVEVEALARHVEKLIDVIEARVPEALFAVETAILRLPAGPRTLATLHRWGGRTLSTGPDQIVGLLCDVPERIDEALAALGPVAATRSGAMAVPDERTAARASDPAFDFRAPVHASS